MTNFHEITCPRCGWSTSIPIRADRLDGEQPDDCPDCGRPLADVEGEDIGPDRGDPDADYDRGR